MKVKSKDTTSDVSGGTQNETEGTLGLAWHANKYLKFEQGVTRASDRSWQFVAREWSFGGN